MKMTLSQKILTGFAGSAIILLLVALYSFISSRKFIDSSKWVMHTHEVMYELEQALASSVNAESSVRGYLLVGDPVYLQSYETAGKDIGKHIEKLKTLTQDNPAQQQNIENIRVQVNKRLAYHNETVEAFKKSPKLAQEIFASGTGRQLQNELKLAVENSVARENTLLQERLTDTDKEENNFTFTFIIMGALLVLVKALVFFIIRNNLQALRKAENESKEKNWLLTGSFEINEKIRGEQNTLAITQSIIEYLCRYLKAQVGVIYLQHNNQLQLAGTYAFQHRKQNAALLNIGEGLVGQAALEKKTIIFTDIPDDYIRIESGLGNSIPKNLAIVPLLTDDQVKAVIEIGTARQLSQVDIQLLQLISENLAIAISVAQSRTIQKDLLEETQRQSEELETQQEELRQTNGELQEKTTLLERSEAELKAQQEELQQSNEELEEKANLLELQKEQLQHAKLDVEVKARELEITGRYKSEFLANMSHELRTPLNSILILSQILAENKKKTLSEKDIELSKNIHHSGQDLLKLINEILDLSKVEAGKLELEISPVSLREINQQLNSTFSEVAANKSIEFTIQNDAGGDQTVITTDRQRLEQVLKNLLSNAFKFTPLKGHVSLHITRATPGKRFKNARLNNISSIIVFAVRDSGIGIPADKLSLVFEAFQQVDGSTKRKYGGTGLGLSISRELANVLGGEIQVESTEGTGSTFTLYLPQQFDASVMEATDKKVEVKEKKPAPALNTITQHQQENTVTDDRYNIVDNDKVILILEDDPVFASLLLEFVRERQYKGIIANQGNTGLSFARHYKPDAILLDMHLPVMDGEEVLRHLKNAPELRHIPVQIISGHDHKKHGLELGAFDFIQKPVDKPTLQKVFDKIEDFIRKKLKKLLIVEDNEQQNKAIRELIGNGDVKSYSAFSGTDAYEMMKNENFDCVIVDLGLPGMSGFELLDKIKADEQLRRVPVIVYTGRDITKEEHDQLMKSAKTVVLKTANSQERLLDETMLFLHRVESRLPREKQNIIRKLHRSDEILKNKKILLVDDDIRNIYSLTNVLEEEGVHCITAENGKLALEALKANPDTAMILMDVMMPEMDGYETTKAIRKMEQFARLPIIAITAKAMKGDREKCLEAGMSDYISKPVNSEQLLSLMRVWLYA